MTNIAINEAKNIAVEKRALTFEKITDIEKFWHCVSEESFVTTDDINISYAVNFTDAKRAYIVIVPGRTEGYLKYKELAYDLDQQGFDCVIIDHRGQGLSQRLLTNKFKGYVEKFDHYAKDLHQLLSQVLPEKHAKQCQSSFMLAHSMGGPIALRYLQNYENNVRSLVLSSPMIAVSSGNTPLWLAKFLITCGTKLNSWLSNNNFSQKDTNLQKDSWYFFDQQDNEETPFETNVLMHSPERYQHFQSLYQANPRLQLGGVTFHWLKQALQANKDIFQDIEKIKIPLLMMQAGKEKLVDNEAQNDFCQQLYKINATFCINDQPMVISGAYHELFFEIDEYRNTAIDATVSWFQSHG